MFCLYEYVWYEEYCWLLRLDKRLSGRSKESKQYLAHWQQYAEYAPLRLPLHVIRYGNTGPQSTPCIVNTYILYTIIYLWYVSRPSCVRVTHRQSGIWLYFGQFSTAAPLYIYVWYECMNTATSVDCSISIRMSTSISMRDACVTNRLVVSRPCLCTPTRITLPLDTRVTPLDTRVTLPLPG